MNEKKSGGFNALVLAVLVLLIAFSVVKVTGGTATGAGASNGTVIVGTMSAGTYTATAAGFSSDVTVTITVNDDGVITDVTIDASGETEAIGGAAAGQLESIIIDEQGNGFDGVSGASFTSGAVREALGTCMQQAAAE